MKFTLLFALLTISQLAFSDYKVETKTHSKQEFLEQMQKKSPPQKMQEQQAPKKLYRKGL